MTPSHGIDFDRYKTQSKDLLKQARAGDPEALLRLRTHHPEGELLVKMPRLQLADAQLAIARENEFPSWAKFKEHILLENAVHALDTGDAVRLKTLLDAHPEIVKYRTQSTEFGYFAQATLLHHVAGNPIRCPLPQNILNLTATILEHGADPNALCGAPVKSNSTIGLILTGKQPSEAGVSVPLIDLLVAAGAKDAEVNDADVLSLPLWNGGRSTAEALVRRGARLDLRHAAALGRIDVMEKLLSGENISQQLLEDSLVYACLQNEETAARCLIQHGARGDIYVSSPNGSATALHEAAYRGFEPLVKLLLDNGASTTVRDKQWNGTPAGWAQHGGHTGLAELLHEHETLQTGGKLDTF